MKYNVYVDEIDNTIALFAIHERHDSRIMRYTKKFHIDCVWDAGTRVLSAIYNGETVCTRKFDKTAPDKEDYLDLFTAAVKLLVKRQSIIVGYRFILD